MRCTNTTEQYICTFSPQVKSYFGLSKKSGVFESRKSELRVLGKFMRKDRGKIRAQHVFFRDPSE